MNAKIKTPKLITHLWYDNKAIEAAKFYVSIFPNSKIESVSKVTGTPSGDVDVVRFVLAGRDFYAISAGPLFKFNEAISLMVYCDTQAQIDYYWKKLSAGPQTEACGWLKDKYGLSWQIVPTLMDKIFRQNDPKRIARVMQAFPKKKFNIADLQKAARGKS